jgi:hypothetical protein
MDFKEIASRLTGISTPVGGISWQPPDETQTQRAHRLIAYLEDRRVLYAPYQFEVPQECVDSVLEIRKRLTADIEHLDTNSELAKTLRAMRAACRQFLDRTSRLFGGGPDARTPWPLPYDKSKKLDQALGELRAIFGICIANIAVQHHLDVEEPLAGIIPASQTD